MDLIFKSAHELHDLIKSKEVSVLDIANSFIKRIKSVDNKINAYITFDENQVINNAKLIDEYIAKNGEIKKFTGIPISIKDNICIKGVKTTCASKMLSNYISVYDSTVVKKLNSHRYLLLGKANMDEFAMGSSNENSSF